MATLTQRTEALEERTDRLETILAAFMARTDESIARLERIVERMEQEAARDREEAARDREEAARDREEDARQRERDREEAARQREEDARQREHDREETARQREETARQREETARQRERDRKEAARERQEMNKRWGELANKMGTVVEDIVAPSIRRLAREVFACGEQQYFATRVTLKRSDDRSREREFDALYVGTDAVLLNQTKSTARSEDVREFAGFVDGGEFARYFPQYGHLPIRAAFSSLSLAPDLVTNLTRRGIYAIAMGDEAMQVLNLQAVRGRRA